jgi:hypothetical protein
MFDSISTNAVANPIDIPLIADEVVARVGHIPKTSTKVGFSLNIPFSIICIFSFITCSFII